MRAILAAILLFCMVFFFGFKVAQDYGLDQCKKAGWEFIEKEIYIRLCDIVKKASQANLMSVGQDNDLLKIVEL